MYDWSGIVPAVLEQGQPTGLVLQKGDVISIVASGWVQFGASGNPWAGPQGIAGKPPQAGGNLIAKIGDKTYVIGNGILHKTVPVDGELIFLFSDNYYKDNSGNFYVNVKIESRYSPLEEIK
ncbi:lectin [Xenorhabdus nematophila]|uniref:PA-I galactophilic lectin (PA-IL) (Galactose-binding lectin) n=1 Tax=Xenorhabdus nematophila (strain ATCC 19061 / DSM 3370 / CCUG 14189 / LMG 1036 / NCIMB 9965 / AN6) TaxID=406817 RepID=D3VES3_XENNA|nr:LecA/PA-IL family lectin [Xenorhabdus nematophila]CEE91753.1 putative PA-I galactophilic lectin (PA-IL) (Galactose-binding lectin) [Xenorhabdus nematophila str. Anatoliense]CEF30376.1 putative PA-I galactophilic lectin (PA-IL) (Galactose-binding lectin) [Xenorhabdus nematophila str. Websteri]AYA40326.1 lectin [Xenorhabdus nematophila]KHD28744.1 lectin [Xenorhabdus nematophila]MBA0018998.1 lectin [Xenorhabdus nematophila]